MNPAYKLIKTEELKDMDSVGYLYEHIKTGARVCYIKNSDDNKVFYIGFRTPPHDSTGVAHILEHSVLCGSRKYPLKDPFVELVKGSLNTFLNAMTYPDKTVYPVASVNDKDFANLMDVYMDAVFYPNIYEHKEIFTQEGWHYEMLDASDELKINGVVYNEMKGAFSSPEDVLNRQILNSLYPDNTYAYESGGDPKDIPSLSYENFLEFHKKFYSPSNSYIYLYGDMDIDERLDYLDREYLSKFDKIEVDSVIPLQKPFSKPVELTVSYPVEDNEDIDNKTFLSFNTCVCDTLDPKLYQAMNIVDYCLLSSPGAPLKKALFASGIGDDVYGSFDTTGRQSMYSIVAQNATIEDKDRFVSIIMDTMKSVVSEGIDEKSILAAINSAEFSFSEADFGSYPKGLIYGLQLLDSWLYDKDEPFMHLHAIDILEELKGQIKNRYFESLIENLLINNNHRSVVLLTPEAGLTTKNDKMLADKLAEYKSSLSAEEINAIVDFSNHLKEYQAAEDSKEDLAKIPLLTREDLKRTPRPVDLEVSEYDGTTLLYSDVPSQGINYLSLYFDVTDICLDDVPYMTLLEKTLGLMDTKEHSYTQLSNDIDLYTGGIAPVFTASELVDKQNELKIFFGIRGKYFENNFSNALSLIKEMLFTTSYEDDERLFELIKREYAKMESSLASAGHQVAAIRARANFSVKARMTDLSAGEGYYNFIKSCVNDYDNNKSKIKAKLYELVQWLLAKNTLMVHTIGSAKAKEQAIETIKSIKADITNTRTVGPQAKVELLTGNDAYTDAAQIQYVCRAGNFKNAGFEYSGAYRILKTILGYDYFWLNVRVQGGAYGCMSGFTRNGDVHFVSYRDPNLEATNEIFNNTADYISNFDVDERTMTKYIIGTVSGMDTPLTPSQRGLRAFEIYVSGFDYDRIAKERLEVIDATSADIRALAPAISAILEQNHLCVVGNSDKIREAADMFDRVQPLM